MACVCGVCEACLLRLQVQQLKRALETAQENEKAAQENEKAKKKTRDNAEASLSKHRVPEDQKLIIKAKCTNKTDELANTLVIEAVLLANGFLSIPQVSNACKTVGVSHEKLQATEIKIQFRSPRTDGYAHAWTVPGNEDTIFLDRYLLDRYIKICPEGPASDAERKKIVVLLAWKVVHELAHLGFRWANGPKAETPERLGRDSGEYVETFLLGGFGGFLYRQAKVKNWNGTQAIVDLVVTKTAPRGSAEDSRKHYRVEYDYIERVVRKSATEDPCLRNINLSFQGISGEEDLSSQVRICSSPANTQSAQLQKKLSETTDPDEVVLAASCDTHFYYVAAKALEFHRNEEQDENLDGNAGL